MFGSDYDKQFGIPPFPFIQMDPQGGFFGGGALGGVTGGYAGLQPDQPVLGASAPGASLSAPGAPGGAGAPSMRSSAPDAGIGPSASPSVDALRSGNPLAAVGANSLAAGAGAAPGPGAGAPALQFTAGGGRAT